jgi:hypothetical protein
MLTIQATQEAKKGGIMDPDQPVQNNLEDPISMEKNLGTVVHACHSRYSM